MGKPAVCVTRGCDSIPMPPSRTLCQTHIAQLTGYDRAHISRVLRGERRPSLQAARRIALVLGMSLDAFTKYVDRQAALRE